MSVAELEQSTDQVIFFLHYWTFGCIVQDGSDDVFVRLREIGADGDEAGVPPGKPDPPPPPAFPPQHPLLPPPPQDRLW